LILKLNNPLFPEKKAPTLFFLLVPEINPQSSLLLPCPQLPNDEAKATLLPIAIETPPPRMVLLNLPFDERL
jgi:hypothetical protein